MPPGPFLRRLMGRRNFRAVARFYRALFVDLGRMARLLSPFIPPASRVLDVGGGHGEPMNHLLPLRPDLEVTMVDLAPEIGSAISDDLLPRVRFLPGTRVDDPKVKGEGPFPVILLLDVVHHIPPGERMAFFSSLRAVVGDSPTRLIIKDVERGHIRSVMSVLADRYLTGDRHVRLVGRAELLSLVKEAFPGARAQEIPLLAADPPNYAYSIWLNAA